MATLLRTGDFVGQDVVAAKFIRSDVVRDNDQPLRVAKSLFWQCLCFGSAFFWCGDLRGLSRNRGRGCEGRPETVGCRLEGLLASQGAKESVQNLGGFGSDREEFRMPSSAEESEPVREPDLVFDLAG
jgi:hypothetical protein